tara:strand:- start:811 stop:1065 length:255 start_codon:yes stop_codon:yes gene_type:complete
MIMMKIIMMILTVSISYVCIRELFTNIINDLFFDPSQLSFQPSCDEWGCGDTIICSLCVKSVPDLYPLDGNLKHINIDKESLMI